jgi:hypothetical protein
MEETAKACSGPLSKLTDSMPNTGATPPWPNSARSQTMKTLRLPAAEHINRNKLTMSSRYEKTSKALVIALVGYYHLRQKGEDPGISWVAACLPNGSLKGMSFDPSLFEWADKCPDLDMSQAAFVRVQGIKSKVEGADGWRLVDLEGVIVALGMHLYGEHPHIKNTAKKPAPPKHYVYSFKDEFGHTWQRLISGAGRGKDAELAGYHRDLRMHSLKLVPGPAHTWKTREGAIALALSLYDAADDKLGISRALYEAMLRQFFRDLDDRHGHKLRVDPSLTPQAAAE